jgi:hypothetical protein
MLTKRTPSQDTCWSWPAPCCGCCTGSRLHKAEVFHQNAAAGTDTRRKTYVVDPIQDPYW